ncbi:hypothetical protein EVAR_66158_1 [Eumeta japonica]|uniref:Uncharacterized protein n=1 Tax=Eumeta variegata TaxID=151549 RepID=A0A4C2A6T3_EUMVA|nr:hypothetical protein EVAR_66158_1 [Eumeta japonica]
MPETAYTIVPYPDVEARRRRYQQINCRPTPNGILRHKRAPVEIGASTTFGDPLYDCAGRGRSGGALKDCARVSVRAPGDSGRNRFKLDPSEMT